MKSPLPLLILALVMYFSSAHGWEIWKWRHRPRPRLRPRWREDSGSCTFHMPCNTAANTMMSTVSFHRRFVKLEVSPPFNARQVGYFRRRYVIRNNQDLPTGTLTIPFTIRYWGLRRPYYFCGLICYSCTTNLTPSPTPAPTSPTKPPIIPTIPSTSSTVAPTLPTTPPASPTIPPTSPTVASTSPTIPSITSTFPTPPNPA